MPGPVPCPSPRTRLAHATFRRGRASFRRSKSEQARDSWPSKPRPSLALFACLPRAVGLMTTDAPADGDDIGPYAILMDIQGTEDHYGDMDFKVAGTAAGITAIQVGLLCVVALFVFLIDFIF